MMSRIVLEGRTNLGYATVAVMSMGRMDAFGGNGGGLVVVARIRGISHDSLWRRRRGVGILGQTRPTRPSPVVEETIGGTMGQEIGGNSLVRGHAGRERRRGRLVVEVGCRGLRGNKGFSGDQGRRGGRVGFDDGGTAGRRLEQVMAEGGRRVRGRGRDVVLGGAQGRQRRVATGGWRDVKIARLHVGVDEGLLNLLGGGAMKGGRERWRYVAEEGRKKKDAEQLGQAGDGR